MTTSKTAEKATHIVTTYHRGGVDRAMCTLIEIVKPTSKFDTDTHRVKFIGGGIIRVGADQLKPI